MRPRFSSAVLLAIVACNRQTAPSVEISPNAFVTIARSATAKYQSQDAAIADGFHRVGTDFPAMGEHWVNLAQVMADSFAPGKPSVLTYITIGGAPRLAGVAYTKLLGPHDLPPDFAPARGQWHEHNGSIVEESFLAGHEKSAPTADLRLAILHAWIWIENPDGMFVTDNWSLPFARLGITMPDGKARDAARIATLATTAADFYRQALDEGLTPSAEERLRYDGILNDYQRKAAVDVQSAAARRSLTAEESRRLAALWPELWLALETALPGRTEALHEVRHRVTGMSE